ncbi:type II toxin-antitoxin system PemK/MazF family toxin [Streptosporangium sp. NPDC049644]|uniref:type II toxin-antitoxin system PemK/MazF family toxin n=1 Tax=Streptosporangium sp. NPDC049644 TaxID=3155507 RepID=UPI00341FD59A
MTYARGDVYRLRAPKNTVGHEQRGERFAILLPPDRLAHISTMLVAPTSTSAAPSIFRPEIELDGTTTRGDGRTDRGDRPDPPWRLRRAAFSL